MRDLLGSAAPGQTLAARRALVGVRLSLALAMLVLAARNLGGNAHVTADLARWGWPAWTRVLVGLVQLGGALLLLASASAPYGAALLAVVLVAALSAHLLLDPPTTAIVPAACLLAALVVMVAYRPPALR